MDFIKNRSARMRRRVVQWSNLIGKIYDRNKHRLVMLGFTYRVGEEWKPNDFRDFLRRYRRYLGGGLLAYAWVSELQERGVVHYHLIILVKRGTDVPYPDKAGFWKFGSTKVISAKSPFYLVTYLKKQYQKDYGKMAEKYRGMRCFAVWADNDQFNKLDFWLFRLTALPMWLEILVSAIEDWCGLYPYRISGVGWCVKVPRHMRKGIYKKYNVMTSDWIMDYV
jgi:hypothetical protein